jgi:hypothetical protein
MNRISKIDLSVPDVEPLVNVDFEEMLAPYQDED